MRSVTPGGGFTNASSTFSVRVGKRRGRTTSTCVARKVFESASASTAIG